MVKGHFYYIKDEYFVDFPDIQLMQNKEITGERSHDRPCYYAFESPAAGLYWMIPISSQIEKYRKYYNQKMKKYHRCDTIEFGEVLGHEKAFLIQNMCPVTAHYKKTSILTSILTLLSA